MHACMRLRHADTQAGRLAGRQEIGYLQHDPRSKMAVCKSRRYTVHYMRYTNPLKCPRLSEMRVKGPFACQRLLVRGTGPPHMSAY